MVSAAGAGAASLLLLAPAAEAHGLVGRTDLPIPEWLFAWAGTAVLVISFVALAAFWRSPILDEDRGRRLVRIPRWLDAVCGAIGVALFAGLVYVGFAGSQTPTENPVPTVVYVLMWCLLVPVSALFGDVFRAFSPWRAIGRAAGWLVTRVGGSPPEPLDYPRRLGLWPAVAGLLVFGYLELIAPDGDQPRVLAILMLVYLAVQLLGQGLYGVDRWIDRGDTFGVYFGFFARLAPLFVRQRELRVRRPLSGLSNVTYESGTIALLCAAIGITALDGAAEGPLFNSIRPELQDAFAGLGLSLGNALQLTYLLAMVIFIGIVAGFYRLGVSGMRIDVERHRERLAQRFAYSLVPIALAYVFAHYFSLIVYQSQAMSYLVSDPLGNGADLFGTAATGIDYSIMSATTIWYVQVTALVVGHVLALSVAHDRALVDFGPTQEAVRSQYWMLAVMVGFTSLGLWLLSESNG